MPSHAYYQPKPHRPLLGLALVALGGVLVAMLFAFAYNFLLVALPVVYLNVLACVGYGIVLGATVVALCRLAKVNAKGDAALLAALAGVLAVGFQWVAYMMYLTFGEHSFANYLAGFTQYLSPALMAGLILDVNKNGAWELFGLMFTDAPLWAIWAMEALAIAGVPVAVAWRWPMPPYHHGLGQWYRKRVLAHDFGRIVGMRAFVSLLEEDPPAALRSLSYGEPFRFAQATVYSLPHAETQYLSIDHVRRENNGRGKWAREPVVRLLAIDPTTAQGLMAQYGVKKSALLALWGRQTPNHP